jgi:hypothetical protein
MDRKWHELIARAYEYATPKVNSLIVQGLLSPDNRATILVALADSYVVGYTQKVCDQSQT